MTTSRSARDRGARLRLLHRLQLARHGADLLRSKEEALRRERDRLEGHAARSTQQWHRQWREASRWLLRARVLGAGEELGRLADTAAATATVSATWRASMGITYPGAVTCSPGPTPTLTSTAALVPATAAHRRALAAAAEHAAASTALERLDAELVATRRRRRAIEQRLIPRLDAERAALELLLEERDREEAVRVLLATEGMTR